MSIPRRNRSRMAASEWQAGPMVQMILARRTEAVAGTVEAALDNVLEAEEEGCPSGWSSAISPCLLAFNFFPHLGITNWRPRRPGLRQIQRENHRDVACYV